METAGGLLVVVSGPSGAGKTTVVDRLLAGSEYERAITATTRAPRGGEVDGVDYLFLSRDEFEARTSRGEFLEHATVHGNLYGTPREQVSRILDRGGVCLLNVDVQGAATIRERVESALFVFLTAPDLETLEGRLRGRATEGEADLARRLEVAREEMAREAEYDVSVVNDDLDDAVRELGERIEERRTKEQTT